MMRDACPSLEPADESMIRLGAWGAELSYVGRKGIPAMEVREGKGESKYRL